MSILLVWHDVIHGIHGTMHAIGLTHDQHTCVETGAGRACACARMLCISEHQTDIITQRGEDNTLMRDHLAHRSMQGFDCFRLSKVQPACRAHVVQAGTHGAHERAAPRTL